MPADLPKRTIEELVLRYELEPTLRDVFVEGTSDKTVLRWFIDAYCTNRGLVAVIPIDEIDITPDILMRHDLLPGNRSEVVALCLELERQLAAPATNVTGIVDLDFFGILPGDHESTILVKSDFSCLEMYFFLDACLTKALKLAFPEVSKSAHEIVNQLAPVLRELFLLRGAAHGLRLGAKWIEFDSFISVKSGVLSYRLEDHQRHYLQKSSVWDRREELAAAIADLRAKLPGDFRFEANGHDAVLVLGLYLKAFYRKAKDFDKTRPDILAHILTCSLEASELANHPMFQAVLQRVS